MQIKYLKQLHQEKAINSTIDIFVGQNKTDSDYDIFVRDGLVYKKIDDYYEL